METQERIVNYYNRTVLIRVIAPYGASVMFALIAAALIIFAPESRTVAANIVAAGLLVLSVAIAGFTRFFAKLPGMELKADRGIARPRSADSRELQDD